jgi:hypothetical protein
MSLEADSLCLGLDQSVDINIMLDQVNNLYAVAFDLVFDPNVFEFVSINEGFLLNCGDTETTGFIYQLDSPGRLIVAITRLGNASGVSSDIDVLVASIGLISSSYAESIIYLENVGLIDPDLNLLPAETSAATVLIVGSPEISEFPDLSFNHGESISIALNEYVDDPDTENNMLSWEILEAGFLDATIDQTSTLHLSSSEETGVSNILLSVSDGYFSITGSMIVTVIASVSNSFDVEDYAIRPNVISIYPNPVNSSVVAKCTEFGRALSHKIYNCKGQLVKSCIYKPDTFKDNSIIFQVNSLPNGRYYLVINNNYLSAAKFTICR